jgi:hypothetical protein
MNQITLEANGFKALSKESIMPLKSPILNISKRLDKKLGLLDIPIYYQEPKTGYELIFHSQFILSTFPAIFPPPSYFKAFPAAQGFNSTAFLDHLLSEKQASTKKISVPSDLYSYTKAFPQQTDFKCHKEGEVVAYFLPSLIHIEDVDQKSPGALSFNYYLNPKNPSLPFLAMRLFTLTMTCPQSLILSDTYTFLDNHLIKTPHPITFCVTTTIIPHILKSKEESYWKNNPIQNNFNKKPFTKRKNCVK